MRSGRKVFVIVHNVRSLHNVGSVFRTADGAGVTKIFLTGYTPMPVDELGRVRKEIHKTALGAEKWLSWEKTASISKLIDRLQGAGVKVVALENTKGAKDYRVFRPSFPLALIVGNEVRGLSPAILKKCDSIVQIPMRGKKESLNVAVAFGIAIYKIVG
ncbi:MAG: RNA methyltransferase [Candidatus Ryanbacteria bacterium]|nr:RNA methyltransferase [Candidatus Ryanbacteria bacterium]